MVPDPSKTSLGLEYFCDEGDALWAMDDAELIALGARETERIGLALASEVEDGRVVRVPDAYPIYDRSFAEQRTTVRDFLATLENLQSAGRNGLHHYDNQDHAMQAGLRAARALVTGTDHGVWSVNQDAEYLEEDTGPPAAS